MKRIRQGVVGEEADLGAPLQQTDLRYDLSLYRF